MSCYQPSQIQQHRADWFLWSVELSIVPRIIASWTLHAGKTGGRVLISPLAIGEVRLANGRKFVACSISRTSASLNPERFRSGLKTFSVALGLRPVLPSNGIVFHVQGLTSYLMEW